MARAKRQNGYLAFRTARERDAAYRLIKAAPIRPTTIMRKYETSDGFLIGIPGVSQLMAHAYYNNAIQAANPQAPTTQENPSPQDMTAGQINKALDKLDAERSKLTDAMIDAGRGYERPSEYLHSSKTDLLSQKMQANHRARMALRIEVERRYGPGAPSRLPKGFGPIKRNPSQRPSLIGSIAETYVPIDLMEETVTGGVEDLKRAGRFIAGNPDVTMPIPESQENPDEVNPNTVQIRITKSGNKVRILDITGPRSHMAKLPSLGDLYANPSAIRRAVSKLSLSLELVEV